MRVIRPNDLSTVDGSFARATTGRYYDAAGILQSAAINVPRFDTDPDLLLFKGLLLEESRTNLYLQSENLTNASWTKVSCTITNAASTVGPTGATGAVQRIVEDNTTSGKYYAQGEAFTSGQTYTLSFYAKEDGTSAKRYPSVIVPSAVITPQAFVIWDLATATSVVGGSPVGTAIQKLPNGWFRLSITFTATTTVSASVQMRITNASNNFTAYLGDNASGFFVYGLQLENHTLTNALRASSYITTTTVDVTRAADVITGSGLIYTTVTDPNALWSSGTTYSIGQKVRYNNFVYESLQNTNLNKQPDTQVTWWLKLYPDNMHAALDTTISTISTATTTMTFVVKPGSINAIALLNVDANVVDIGLTDPIEGNVYYATYGLSGVSVYDWYQYFFYDPILKRTQIVLENIPQYTNGLVTIRLTGPVSEITSVAQALFGQSEVLGLTQYGVNAGIVDYSKKETDEFGTITFVERPFSKRLSAEVFVDNLELNRIQNLLYAIRAKPSVWIASTNPLFEEALIIYGFYRDFSTNIAYPSHSICNLEIEGLT